MIRNDPKKIGSQSSKKNPFAGKSSAEILAELARLTAQNEERAIFEFVFNANGEQILAGVQEGSMVTVQQGNRIFGIYPERPVGRSKNVSVSLLELKSAKQPPSKGKHLRTVKAAPGTSVHFDEADLHLSVTHAVLPIPPGGSGQCCVQVQGNKWCAACYIYWDDEHNCCTGFICCLWMRLNRAISVP